MSLSKKEKRAFQRLVTGLTIGCNFGAYYRFLTLTTSKESLNGGYYCKTVTKQGVFFVPRKFDINRDFDTLKKRISRATVKNDGFYGFKFNRYFKLKTDEGNGVLHIIYWGGYIPHEWLKKVWLQIHSSPVVDIRSCKGGKGTNVKGLVGYLLTNYLTKQPILRMSYGWKWAWLGLVKSWTNVKQTQSFLRKNQHNGFSIKQYRSFRSRKRNASLEYWKSLLKNPKPTSRQIKFCNPNHTKLTRRWLWQGVLSPIKLKQSSKQKELVKWRSYWIDHVEVSKPIEIEHGFVPPYHDFGDEGLNRFWNPAQSL